MSASTTAIIAAVAARRRKLISRFVSAGATSEARAVPADSLPRPGFRMLHRLKREGVICETPDGLLYLDQGRANELQARRQSSATKLMAVVVLVVLAVAAFVALRPVA
jgi:hypothetical protein